MSKQFSVNSTRNDPYKNFRFQVKIDGTVVAGVQKCSGLKRTTETSDWRAGDESPLVRKLPGRTSYQSINLEAGLTYDDTFQIWANQVFNIPQDGGDATVLPTFFRRNIQILVLNEAGQVALTYNVYNCWPSEFMAVPDLDSNGHAIGIMSMKIEHEGFQNVSVEPTEPVSPLLQVQ